MSGTPSQQDVDEALRTFDDLIDSTGDQVIESISGHTDDGRNVVGRMVQHGSQKYRLVAAVGQPTVQLQYAFNAAEAVAVNRAVADGGQPTATGPAPQVHVGPENIEQAKDEIRGAADGEEHLKDIRQGLIDRVSQPRYAANLNAEAPFTYGFEVSAKFFPYGGEDITVTEFAEKAQSIVSLGWKGQEFLAKEYGLQDLIDDGSGVDGPRGFQ